MRNILIGLMATIVLVAMVACTTPSSPSGDIPVGSAAISAITDDAHLVQAGALDSRKKKRKRQNNEPPPEWIEWTPGDVWPIPEPTPCEDDNLLWWRADCE